MTLATMRFCGLSWRYNPTKLQIKHKRINHSFTLPMSGERVAPLCRACRVISGKGEIVGVDCHRQFSELEKLYLEGRRGLLTVAGMEPLQVYFTALGLDADTAPDLITYSFEFTEADSAGDVCAKAQYHSCAEGETLFDIAYGYGTSVDALVELNPSVRYPCRLRAGERVRLW